MPRISFSWNIVIAMGVIALFFLSGVPDFKAVAAIKWMLCVVAAAVLWGACNYALRYPAAASLLARDFSGESHVTGGITEFRFLVFVFCAGALASYVLSGLLFGHMPGQMDSYAYYIQAKIFALGHWSLPSHPMREFFSTAWFIDDGRFYSKYPPGHSLLMAVFFATHLPTSLMTPLLTGTGCVLIYYLAREIANIRTGRIACFLAFASPIIMFMSAEYMNHMTGWVCVTGFTLFYIRAHRGGFLRDALLAGAFMGFLFLTRPQVCVPFALPFIAHWFFTLRSKPAQLWKNGAAMAGVAGIGVLIFLYGNWILNGSPWLTGYDKYDGPVSLKTVTAASWHDDMARVLKQTRFFHIRLFGWPLSSLALVMALFALSLQRRYCALLACAGIALACSLFFTPYDGGIYQPRYLFETTGLFVVLTAVCLQRLPVWWRTFQRSRRAHVSYRAMRRVTYAGLILLVAFSWPTVREMYNELVAKNWPDRQNMDFHMLIMEHTKRPALVFIGGRPENYFFGSVFNPPLENAPVIAARNLGERNPQLMEYYPGRYVYMVDDKGLRMLRSPMAVTAPLQ